MFFEVKCNVISIIWCWILIPLSSLLLPIKNDETEINVLFWSHEILCTSQRSHVPCYVLKNWARCSIKDTFIKIYGAVFQMDNIWQYCSLPHHRSNNLYYLMVYPLGYNSVCKSVQIDRFWIIHSTSNDTNQIRKIIYDPIFALRSKFELMLMEHDNIDSFRVQKNFRL